MQRRFAGFRNGHEETLKPKRNDSRESVKFEPEIISDVELWKYWLMTVTPKRNLIHLRILRL
jgi:hypothetical protein